jgi:hypothetical protein
MSEVLLGSARERERDGNGSLNATNIEDITDMRE